MAKPAFGYPYPRPAVTTDCVIFGFDAKKGILKVLLVERGLEPFKGKPALPGGFVRIKCTTDKEGNVIEETNETLLECAKRELLEETGLNVNYIDELGTFSTPGRDPRCIAFTDAYYALVPISNVKGGDDAADARWINLMECLDCINHMPIGMRFLAFDHDDILKKAFTRLQEQLFFKPIAFSLLPEKFTISQLQKIYEVILGRDFDRRNFARKIMDCGVLDVVPSLSRNKQYTLNKVKFEEMLHSGKRIKLWI